MWNDTETPLALLITFRCRGTWLHGDERGSVDRHNNIYGTPKIPPNETWHRFNKELLEVAPVKLGAQWRAVVAEAIRETCAIRGWELYAFNIRTNHAHSVLHTGGIKPGKVLHALKANATRKLREAGLWTEPGSPWAERGSKRRLWNERSVQAAIDYVLYGQGDDLPDFDK